MINPILSQLKPNNPMQMLAQFNQFRQQMAGKDPEAIVKELLSSGKMTQQQFDQFSTQAQSFMSLLK